MGETALFRLKKKTDKKPPAYKKTRNSDVHSKCGRKDDRERPQASEDGAPRGSRLEQGQAPSQSTWGDPGHSLAGGEGSVVATKAPCKCKSAKVRKSEQTRPLATTRMPSLPRTNPERARGILPCETLARQRGCNRQGAAWPSVSLTIVRLLILVFLYSLCLLFPLVSEWRGAGTTTRRTAASVSSPFPALACADKAQSVHFAVHDEPWHPWHFCKRALTPLPSYLLL